MSSSVFFKSSPGGGDLDRFGWCDPRIAFFFGGKITLKAHAALFFVNPQNAVDVSNLEKVCTWTVWVSLVDWNFCFSGYLKLWQMSSPVIDGYDVILLDEAQDCTECMRGILEEQLGRCALVLVGDSHQQIYGFRRASDALVTMPASHSYYLTQVGFVIA